MKEMKNICCAFEECEGQEKDSVGCTKMKCHMVWDIKLGENFRCEAGSVAGGHVTKMNPSLTHSSAFGCAWL